MRHNKAIKQHTRDEEEKAALTKALDTTRSSLEEQETLRRNLMADIAHPAGLMAAVARRWKGQFSENSKAWGQFEELPEMNCCTTGSADARSSAGVPTTWTTPR